MFDWLPISNNNMPINRPCLVLFQYGEGGKETKLIKKVEKFQLEADSAWLDECDYNEENDTYYCPAGFYEKMPDSFDYAWSFEGETLEHATHFLLFDYPKS